MQAGSTLDYRADDERVAVGAELDYLVELALQMNWHLGDTRRSRPNFGAVTTLRAELAVSRMFRSAAVLQIEGHRRNSPSLRSASRQAARVTTAVGFNPGGASLPHVFAK
jgi:hypothetical protein